MHCVRFVHMLFFPVICYKRKTKCLSFTKLQTKNKTHYAKSCIYILKFNVYLEIWSVFIAFLRSWSFKYEELSIFNNIFLYKCDNQFMQNIYWFIIYTFYSEQILVIDSQSRDFFLLKLWHFCMRFNFKVIVGKYCF